MRTDIDERDFTESEYNYYNWWRDHHSNTGGLYDALVKEAFIAGIRFGYSLWDKNKKEQ